MNRPTGSIESRLRLLMPVLQRSATQFEEEVRTRLTGALGERLLALASAACSFYRHASGAEIIKVDQVAEISAFELEVYSHPRGGRSSEPESQWFFRGPLTGHDEFRRVARYQDLFGFQIESAGMPIEIKQVGDTWTTLANSRDEIHDCFESRLVSVYTFAAHADPGLSSSISSTGTL